MHCTVTTSGEMFEENEKESYNMIKEEEYLSCAEPAIVCNEPQNLDRALSCTIAEDLKG